MRGYRYQKLYSDFKSEWFGWRMVLLSRKFLLVSTTVMFNTLPLFQVCPPHPLRRACRTTSRQAFAHHLPAGFCG
jgi:hypothetical protein